MSSDYSYSYSNSRSDDVDADEFGAMWGQIARMPFDHLQETDNFTYVNKVMTLITKYNFSLGDHHMSDKHCTIYLAKLLKLISSKCAARINDLEQECNKTKKEKDEEMSVLKKKLEAQNEEIVRLREGLGSQVSRRPTIQGLEAPNAFDDNEQEIKNLKEANNKLAMELNRMRRTVDELRQQQQTRLEDRARVNLDAEKTQLEYKHLVARHKRLLEKATKTEELLEEMRKSDRSKRHREDTDLDKLRQKVQSLQEENLKLVESRDRAEELCERRESETLRDMQELKRLSQELINEEKEKLRTVSDALNKEVEERCAQIAELEEELRERGDENDLLREQMQKLSSIPKRHFDGDNSRSSMTSETPADTQELDATSAVSGQAAAELKRLERENDDLAAEVEQLEMRNDAFEEENMRLNRLLKDLEGGDEGLFRLRHQIEDSTRTVEILQSENSQLRERLNGMQDSLTFTAALQELCKRVGVTEEEINSLRPQNAVAFSEMDTLREELNILKEEVEWLERERRYWMNKVRLQPLMDTKLRFELGLSSEQLRQLDELVDQMKAGRIVVEDDDADYKDKYFQELQKRRKDAEQFSEYVKSRIDEAIERTFGEATAGDAAAALSALKEHIDLIADGRLSPSGDGGGGGSAPGQVKSMAHRLDQSALTIKDNSEVIMNLREQLSAATAERDAVCKERDQYRSAIFQAAGVDDEEDGARELESGSNAAEESSGGGIGGGGGIHLSNAKWMTVSKTLRDQLEAKDNLIASFGDTIKELQDKMQKLQQEITNRNESIENLTREKETMKDQMAAVSEMNEELAGDNNRLKKVNKEVSESIERLNQGSSRDVLQKIVLLRRREATLLQRLRRALVSQEEASKSEQTMRRTMQLTFQSMQEAFEGTSTGFVLPPSSATHNSEEEMLSFLQGSANSVLAGRLFREDSRHLLHLQQVYHYMEQFEEVTALRATAKQRQKEKEELNRQLDEQKVELETLKAAAVAAATNAGGSSENIAAKWESEATSWRQKYTLCQKRYEDKVAEVDLLEKELDTSRGELVDMKNYVATLLQEEERESRPKASPQPLEQTTTTTASTTPPPPVIASAAASVPKRTTPDGVAHASRLEREVARLKSINLGLLHHSMDLQATVKSLEMEVEGKKQEILLIKDSGSANVVSDFVSAAIREHTALRRQSELALIQTKRAKMQLAATEANYHIVSNEATAYKLSAYRVYRKYVDQMVSVVDYLRYMQRSCKGALTPHRAEIMDRRYRQLLAEMQSAQSRNKSLAMQSSDQKNAITTLEQQIALSKMGSGTERDDMIEKRLREARSSVRESTRLLVEGKEECKYAAAKANRLESFIKQLEEEMTRLEWCSWSLSPLDEATLNNLLALKETVFSKAEAPPVAIQAVYDMPTFRGGSANDDADVAVREYKAVALKQAEYARECTSLRKTLTDAEVEKRKSAATIAELRDELARLDERVNFYQSQLEAERTKAEARETRLVKAHETQADVARRATEHNSSCLRDMLQKKETSIQQLQEQLHAERQKYAEHQLEEASRMEALHVQMFKENESMVDRFKELISGVGQSLSLGGGESGGPLVVLGGGDSATLSDQLRNLTGETIRLQSELSNAKRTIIILESQLEQQIQSTENAVLPETMATTTPQRASAPPQAMPGALHTQTAAGQQREPYASTPSAAHSYLQTAQGQPNAQYPSAQPYTEEASAPQPAGVRSPEAVPRTASAQTDALTGIIRNQGAMIESLRQRELSLSEELNRERQLRLATEKQLDELSIRAAEKGGKLELLSSVANASEPPLMQELRAQLAGAEQALQMTKEQLAVERGVTRQLQLSAEGWKANLQALQSQTSAQQMDVEQSKHLSQLNEELQKDLNVMKDQNDKLVLAATVLRQKLMDEAQKDGESSRQRQQEVALAQRMGSIQQESLEHMKVLDRRVKTIQRELHAKITKEKEMLTKNEEAQRLVYQLHQQLRQKEREIAELKSGRPPMTTTGTASSRGETPSPQPSAAEGGGFVADKGIQTLVSPEATQLNAQWSLADAPFHPGVPTSQTASPIPQPGQLTSFPPVPTTQGAGVGTASTTQRTASDGGDGGGGGSSSNRYGTRRGVEPPVNEQNALLQPQIAGLVQREIQKNQRDNLSELSALRSTVGRLEQDILEAREYVKGEQEAVRSVRTQLTALRKEKEEAEGKLSQEVITAHRLRAEAEAEVSRLRRDATGSHSTRSQAKSPRADAQNATILRLQRRVEELERGASSPWDHSTERVQSTDALLSGLNPEDIPSSVDVRNHVRQLMRLEAINDELRRKIQVETSVKENELRNEISMLQFTLRRIATDLALTKNVPLEHIMQVYGCPTVPSEKKISELESELLKKGSAIVDLRFEEESLRIQKNRISRHLEDVLAVDRYHKKRSADNKSPILSSSDQTEALQTLVDNMKLVIEKLQQENNDLKSKLPSNARYVELLREVKQLRSKEKDLQEQLSTSRKRSSAGSVMSQQQINLQRRLLTAQATAEQYQTELEELKSRLGEGETEPAYDDVRREASDADAAAAMQWIAAAPPPLPRAPHLASVEEAGSQRRLSSSGGGGGGGTGGGAGGATTHAGMHHHHVSRRK